MTVLSSPTRRKAGAKTAKAIITRPRLIMAVAKATPAAASKLGLRQKHRARRGADQISETTRDLGHAIAAYSARAAYGLGLADAPKARRTAPRVAAGMVIGAGAMYFLEPGRGRKHRKKVAKLLG